MTEETVPIKMEEIRTDNTKTLKNALKRIKELEKKNAELKSIANFQTSSNMDRYFQLKRSKEQLNKAKEVIKKFSEFVNNEAKCDPEYPEYSQELTDLWNELCEQAEQFLKEVGGMTLEEKAEAGYNPPMVEFVSYSGIYPCLCHGELVVKIDGETVNLGRCLRSGGDCYFSSGWEEHVTQGDWKIDELPEAYEKYRKEIEKVANENVPNGCCGGCL